MLDHPQKSPGEQPHPSDFLTVELILAQRFLKVSALTLVFGQSQDTQLL